MISDRRLKAFEAQRLAAREALEFFAEKLYGYCKERGVSIADLKISNNMHGGILEDGDGNFLICSYKVTMGDLMNAEEFKAIKKAVKESGELVHVEGEKVQMNKG